MSESPRRFHVVIVGGGAAGLATAVFTARNHPRISIAVLDGAKKLGAKILVSGGGRCNVTNVSVTPHDFNSSHPRIVSKVLSAFSEVQTAEFFQQIGVALHEEENGKLFPDSHSARSVLEGLLGEAERLKVHILADHRVVEIQPSQRHPESTGFQLRLKNDECIAADCVVLACGGMSLPKTGSDGGGYALAERVGHSLNPPTPALAPLVLEGDFHVGLSGVALPVELTLTLRDEKPVRVCGAMLWTHFGISGPAALDMSRHWTRAVLHKVNATLTASFLPGWDFQHCDLKLQDLAAAQPRTHLVNILSTLIPAQMVRAIIKNLELDPATLMAHLSKEHRRRLVHALLEWPMLVVRDRGYNFAEVTAGGIPLDEIDPATMRSRKCDGIYLVGEMLDVDGRLGGFNFQWAWSSGFVAGRAVARRFADLGADQVWVARDRSSGPV